MNVDVDVDEDISLLPIPSLDALLVLDVMSVDDFGQSLMAGDFSDMVVIGPDGELNSSSHLDEAVLEDTKATLSARSGSLVPKDPLDPFYPFLKEL